MTPRPTNDELLEALGNIPVRFWRCPEPGHSDAKTPLRQTVEWRDGVAYCLEPNCGRTSRNERRRLCAHADRDGRGAHWLEPGQRCPDDRRPDPEEQT